jgi:hypothetical protein
MKRKTCFIIGHKCCLLVPWYIVPSFRKTWQMPGNRLVPLSHRLIFRASSTVKINFSLLCSILAHWKHLKNKITQKYWALPSVNNNNSGNGWILQGVPQDTPLIEYLLHLGSQGSSACRHSHSILPNPKETVKEFCSHLSVLWVHSCFQDN